MALHRGEAQPSETHRIGGKSLRPKKEVSRKTRAGIIDGKRAGMDLAT